MLNQLLDGYNPCGFRVGGELLINHLQLAYDTLIFCGKDPEQLEQISAILEIFLAISGLKVNYSKSSLIGCNMKAEDLQNLARFIDVGVASLPIVYLGAPLGGNPGE